MLRSAINKHLAFLCVGRSEDEIFSILQTPIEDLLNWEPFQTCKCICGESVDLSILKRYPQGNGHCPYCYEILFWASFDEPLYFPAKGIYKLPIPEDGFKVIKTKIRKPKVLDTDFDIDKLMEDFPLLESETESETEIYMAED